MARALILLAAALLSFGLVVAASADPPDPTWIAGCWDDDDQDNAVIAILAIPGWVAVAAPNLTTFVVHDPFVAVAKDSGITIPVSCTIESRAPPLVPPYFV
jgi:hypothetical protein